MGLGDSINALMHWLSLFLAALLDALPTRVERAFPTRLGSHFLSRLLLWIIRRVSMGEG